MTQLYENLKRYLYDTQIDIEERLSAFFIGVGIIAAILGTIIALLSHAAHLGVLSVSLIAIGTPLISGFARHIGRQQLIARVIGILIIFMIPVVYVTAGASEAGITIWFLYELYFITLFTKRRQLPFYLSAAILLQAAAIAVQIFAPQYILSLATETDKLISLIGNLIVVSAEILVTSLIQKRLYLHERQLSSEAMDVTQNFVTSIANTIDTKDTYTGGHSRRVAACAADIARRMGMTPKQIENIHSVALLHDIGKIGVPDRVLNKPGRLSDEEFELVKKHPIYGAEIVSEHAMLPNVREGVLYHHERYDGTGYPEGLKGEEIPLIARIISVADSYDAMSTNRIYRKYIKREQILSNFIKNRGTQFDPNITDVFVRMLMEGYTVDPESQEHRINTDRGLSISSGNLMRTIAESDHTQGTVAGVMNVDGEEFGQIYTYLRNVGHRYGNQLLLLNIGVLYDQKPDEEHLLADMSDLNKALTASLRAVDMCTRYTADSWLVLLLDAGNSNLDKIVTRITDSFYRFHGSRDLKLSHSVINSDEVIKNGIHFPQSSTEPVIL